MRILGIDPGIGRCGWAVIDYKSSKFEIVDFGCIETEAKAKIEDRLLILFEEIGDIIKETKPEVLSIEDLFFNKNAKTNLIVGEARGIILLLGAINKMKIFSYTPLQVKISLTGYGKAEKSQVGFMVQRILKLKILPKLDDTVDALAIAITHAFSNKNNFY